MALLLFHAVVIANDPLRTCPRRMPSKVEDCIDLTLEPRPVGYGATRRMARRFDETLIVEIEMVGTKESFGRIF